MRRVSPENLLLVGKVIRPHGLGGLLRIYSYARSGDTFLKAGHVFLKIDPEEFSEYRIVSVKTHGNAILLRLDGLNSLEDAEIYRGAEIWIRKDGLIRTDGEYFWFEIIGIEVRLENSRYIGRVKEILETGSNDIYVVREGEKEFLIPAVHHVIKKIDLENGEMIVAEMEGLFELNEI